MSETPRSNVGPERIRIDLNADWEVGYWTRKLGITREQLAQAIAAVGDKAHEIVGYFRQLELDAEAVAAQAMVTPSTASQDLMKLEPAH